MACSAPESTEPISASSCAFSTRWNPTPDISANLVDDRRRRRRASRICAAVTLTASRHRRSGRPLVIVKVFGPVHGPEAPASFREVRLTTTHGFGLSVAVEHLGVWMVPDSERGEVARNLQCLCDAVARGDGMPVDKRESDEAGRTGT